MTVELKPVIDSIIKAGYQLSPDAFIHLQGLASDDAEELVRLSLQHVNSLPSDIYIIDKEILLKADSESKRRDHGLPNGAQPRARLFEPSISIVDAMEADPQGDYSGFLAYFRSRFRQLETILKRRIDVKDAIPLENAIKLPVKSKFKTIGLITGKRSQRDRLFLELEDTKSSTTVMASGETARKGLEILNDQVICIDGMKYRDDLIIANDLIWPDIPMRNIKRAPIPANVVFLADIHVGSTDFREDLFDDFLRWMNLELGSIQLREMASRVKYVVITGDLVEGVGIYPDQINDLTITTQKEQYEEAARLLDQLPDYVEIIITPGNHDAVQRSLPQPVIPESYAPSLYANERVHMMPNPVTLDLHGVEVLCLHGKALDEILSSTPGYDFQNPVKAIELLVRCRHCAPIYGQSTPIAPERHDRLVMNSVPAVVQMGHIHINQIKKYKGIHLISTGSFQGQTSFQKRMDVKPTTGEFTIFDLQKLTATPIDVKRMNSNP